MWRQPQRGPPSCRRNLLDLGPEGVEALVRRVARRLLGATRRVPGATPILNVLQRHYPSQRAASVLDAHLVLDLRTALPSGRDQVKPQPLWVRTVHEVLKNRRGTNLPAASAGCPA